MSDYISDKRIYLDKEGKATDDDTKGVSLLVAEGGSLDLDTATKYGLGNSTTVVTETEEPVEKEKTINIPPKEVKKVTKKAKPKTEDKSVKGPKSA